MRINRRPDNPWGLVCESGATCDACGHEGILWERNGLIRCSAHALAAILP